MEGYRFRVGDKVMYHGEQWEIDSLSVSEIKEPGTKISYERGYHIAKRTRGRQLIRYALENEISVIPGNDIPLTAKEYAEKLREVFGVKLEAVDNFEELEICNGVNCRKCPFDKKRLKAAGYHGHCVALIVYHPDLAVKLMDEWQAEKDKPKGKTYLEDIRERLPNVLINKFGIPDGCRKRLCNGIACTDCMPGMEECRKCWNEVMLEEDNAEG